MTRWVPLILPKDICLYLLYKFQKLIFCFSVLEVSDVDNGTCNFPNYFLHVRTRRLTMCARHYDVSCCRVLAPAGLQSLPVASLRWQSSSGVQHCGSVHSTESTDSGVVPCQDQRSCFGSPRLIWLHRNVIILCASLYAALWYGHCSFRCSFPAFVINASACRYDWFRM